MDPHLRKAFEDFKHQSMSDELTHAFANEMYNAVQLVDQANMITFHVRPDEGLEFKLKVLTDLRTQSSTPELAVVVLCDVMQTKAGDPSETRSCDSSPSPAW